MPITAPAEPGGDVRITKTHSSRLAALAIVGRQTASKLRDPNSSKNMVSVPWEDDE
jgi:hypothetical protein